MTWPFENDTSAIIKKLAKADLKEHKLKTFITAMIIVIATCLMATVFSILVNDALNQSTQAPYHAMFRAVGEDTKNKLQTDHDFEAVGVYKTFGNIVNNDGRTDLAYMDDPAMSFLGFERVDGNLPQNSTEVLVSETYLSIHKLALAILISSINLPTMLRQSYPLAEDFQIGIQMDNFYERFPTIIQENPLSEDLQTEIYKIPSVEKIVLDECVVGSLVESKVVYDSPEENLEIVNSLSPELVANAGEVVDGTIHYDELGSNDIVINKYRTDRSDINYRDVKVGDTLRFQFHVAGQTVEKTFTVAGIAYFPSTGLFYCTSEAITELSPYDHTSHLSVFCDPDYKEPVQDGIMALISGNPNLRLKIYDEEFSTIKGLIKATTSSLYGICAFVILFGLLNMVNMLISSAIVRKREFALLRAVGMTNRQLRKMLYREGMSISVKSAILATCFGVTAGALLCYLANKVLALKFILFEFDIFPILLFSVLLVGLQICLSYGVSCSIEKDTLVERLRTE